MTSRWRDTGVAAVMLAGVFLFLEYAPPMAGPDGEYLGEAFRIFYFHVPAAWVSFLMLFASFVASIGYLATRSARWDRWAAATAEVGWVYATIVITTGPIWARAAWGTYWTWEPRLTSFLVLWLMYLGYILLRSSIDDPERRARFAAVLSIIAFLDVPIVFFSVKIWGAIGHPVPNIGFFRDPVIRTTFLANVFAFLLAAVHLAAKRARLECHED
ncbi:MAG: cytochrome c biogenesis protein CcsA [Candidatus Hydrogenedentota bacterium]